jgi:hypothetical protein
MTLAELGMPSISSLLPIPRIATTLDEDGHPAEEFMQRSTGRFLDEFEWHARALGAARAVGTPY